MMCFPTAGEALTSPLCDDGTEATPCCGYGPCSFPLCSCKAGCRSMGPPSNCKNEISTQARKCRRVYTRSTHEPGRIAQVNCSDLFSGPDDGFPVDVWYEFFPRSVILTGVGSTAGAMDLKILYRHHFEQQWFQEREGFYEVPPGEEIRVHHGSINVMHVRLRWDTGTDPVNAWLLGCDHMPRDAIGDHRIHNDPWMKISVFLAVSLLVSVVCGLYCSLQRLWKCCCLCCAWIRRSPGAREHIEVPLLGIIDTVGGPVPLNQESSVLGPTMQTSSFLKHFDPEEESAAEVDQIS